jgi:hypothetical protein
MEELIWNKYMKKLRFDELNKCEWINLKTCYIDTMYDGKEYLKIPKYIEKIYFTKNFNEKIDNLEIPNSVHTIYFSKWFDNNLFNLKINDNVVLEFEKLNKNPADSLPVNLKTLILDYLDFPLENLPPTLENLILKRGETHYKISKIPYGCQVRFWTCLQKNE